MAKLSISQNIDVYCDRCCSPMEAYQHPQTHDISIRPCKACEDKIKESISRLKKRMEVAA